MSGADLDLKLDLILAEVRGLRDDVRALRKKHEPLNPGAVLRAIAACGDYEFSTSDLVRRPRYAGELRELLDGMTPRRIGKLLRQIEGVDFDGFWVERLSENSDGVIWRVWGPGNRNPSRS